MGGRPECRTATPRGGGNDDHGQTSAYSPKPSPRADVSQHLSACYEHVKDTN